MKEDRQLKKQADEGKERKKEGREGRDRKEVEGRK